MSAQDSPIGGFPGTLSVSGVTVDDAGRTLFGATFQIGPGGVTSSNDGVLYQSDGAGSGSILAREGDPVTGAAPGTAYAGSFAGLESQAGIAFRASTTAGSGLFTEDTGGAFAPLVMEGDAAPGTSGAVFGGFFLPFSPGRIDANGTLMFQNTLQSGIGGVTSANDTGFWGPNGLIAREGDQAPGAPAGALFQGFAGVELDDAGFAFRAALQTGPGGVTSANNTGLWRPDDDGGVILLTREGDAVPGLPGVSFADLASAAVAVNAQGETAFLAGFTIGSGGVTTANDKALFFADAHGLLTLLLREGDILPGLGTLQSLEALGGLNEAGQIAVKAFFAPSGAPVNTVVLLLSIPEPSIAWMLGFGFALLGAQRRRH